MTGEPDAQRFATPAPGFSPVAGRVAGLFGLTREDLPAGPPVPQARLRLRAGGIVLLTGPSGGGKTSLLRAARVALRTPQAARPRVSVIDLAPLGRFPARARAIDCVPGAVPDRLAALSRAGLAEARVLITPACALSAGQQQRLALARALGLAARRRAAGRWPILLADELLTFLDAPAAAGIARGLRRALAPSGVTLIAATARSELTPHLQPDQLLHVPLIGPCTDIPSSSGGSAQPTAAL